MKKKQHKKISYEKEADVLRVELSSSPIDYAEEFGPFVVHFSKKKVPVYMELLDASRFLKESERAFTRGSMFAAQQPSHAAFRLAR